MRMKCGGLPFDLRTMGQIALIEPTDEQLCGTSDTIDMIVLLSQES